MDLAPLGRRRADRALALPRLVGESAGADPAPRREPLARHLPGDLLLRVRRAARAQGARHSDRLETVDPQRVPSEDRLAVRVVQERKRLLPDTLVAAAQDRDWPVAPVHDPLRPESLQREFDGRSHLVLVPEPGELRDDLRVLGRGDQLPAPVVEVTAKRWLAEVVDDDRQPGDGLGERPEQPAGIPHRVDEVAYADQAADVDGVRVVERRPPDDARDPVVRRGELEHQLRVRPRVVGLHEDRAVDAGAAQLGLQLLRLERARDRAEVASQPGMPRALEVPEVDVGVDDHWAVNPPSTGSATPVTNEAASEARNTAT